MAFNKSTGDGYLMTFPTVEQAFDLALAGLALVTQRNEGKNEQQRLDLRFAINTGETRVSLDNDRVGIAVNMVFRVEGIQGTGEPVTGSGELPTSPPKENRLLITEVAHNELRKQNRYSAKLAGYFKLKGINGIHPIYYYAP